MQHLIDVEADGVYGARQVLMEKIHMLAPGSFIKLISPVSGDGMLELLVWLKQQQMKPCHLWVNPDAARREAWVKQLKSRGIVCYAVQHLSELPFQLGGGR